MKTAPRITGDKWGENLCHSLHPHSSSSRIHFPFSWSLGQHRSVCACSLLFNQVPVLGEEIVSQQLLLFMVIVAHYTHFYAGIYTARVSLRRKQRFSAPRCSTHRLYSRRGGVCQQTRALCGVCLAAITHIHTQSNWTCKWETCSLRLLINITGTHCTHLTCICK
jgi:hypothetical protein